MSKNVGGDERVSEDNLKQSGTDVWRHTDLWFSFRISSHFLIQLLLLAVRSDHVFEHLDASVSQSKPLNVHTVTILSLAQAQVLRLIKDAWVLNFNKMVECELLVMGVRQLQDIMSTVRTNLRAWLHILEPGTNGVSRSSKARRALATKKLFVRATFYLSVQNALHRDSKCMCSSA